MRWKKVNLDQPADKNKKRLFINKVVKSVEGNNIFIKKFRRY